MHSDSCSQLLRDCARPNVLLTVFHVNTRLTHDMAVPWLRRLVAGLSPRRPGFDSESVHVEFVVDKVTLGQVFPPQYFGFPLYFIPPVLHYTEKL
jgi:hypothetical protein